MDIDEDDLRRLEAVELDMERLEREEAGLTGEIFSTLSREVVEDIIVEFFNGFLSSLKLNKKFKQCQTPLNDIVCSELISIVSQYQIKISLSKRYICFLNNR